MHELSQFHYSVSRHVSQKTDKLILSNKEFNTEFHVNTPNIYYTLHRWRDYVINKRVNSNHHYSTRSTIACISFSYSGHHTNIVSTSVQRNNVAVTLIILFLFKRCKYTLMCLLVQTTCVLVLSLVLNLISNQEAKV